MNFPQFDSYSGLFHFPTESPLCDYQENGSFFSDCQMVDRVGNDVCDSSWLNDDKFAPTLSKSTSPLSIFHKEPQYPQRTSLLGIKRRKLSDLPKSEPLVTKTKHFICKDDFLWNDSKELPDVILVSPRRENTPEPNTNKFNLDDEKSTNNLNFDFDNALRNVQVEVGMDYSVDLVTKEDVEYLDNLLAGLTDHQSNQNFAQDLFSTETKYQVDASDLSSFNEISCNINQQGAVADSQSTIKKLLKDDSFKGNFCMKKSTEILSEIDQSHDSFAEHNYFSPVKVSRPRTQDDSRTPIKVTGCMVPSDSASVPIVPLDYVAETEISSSPISSFNLKTPQIVLSQCASDSSNKPAKSSKNRDATKKSKKPVLPKSTESSKSLKDDPTYKPGSKKRSLKKSHVPKPKTDCSRPVAQQLKSTSDCNVAKLPRIPIKPSTGQPKSSSRSDNVVKPRIPSMSSRVPTISRFVGKVDKSYGFDRQSDVEPDKVDDFNPPTPLASPTRDDFTDQDECTDSCQPETLNSNVDPIVDPIQPVEEVTPKIEKKKISLQEYLQKRATQVKSDPDSVSCAIEPLEPIEPVISTPVPNVEDILRTIVKSEPPPIEDILKSIIAKSEPTPPVDELKPTVKLEPTPPTHVFKPTVKLEPTSPTDVFKPTVKLEPTPPVDVPKPIVKSEPTAPPICAVKPIIKSEPRNQPKVNKPMPKPRRNPTTESKPSKEPDNNAPLKLIKLSIPVKVPSVRSYSLSPNEISQSLDSCDRYSSSGVSSYHNSSVSSTCGSPYTVHDDKSNDTKYSDNERIATTKSKKQSTEKKLPEIPFAVNKELLRKDDRSSRRRRHRREKRRRSDSITRKRKLSDSCFEDDSDCSDYSDRKRSRKRYLSTSSSSSEKSYHPRSHNMECSISPRTYHEFCDWKYSKQEMFPEPYYYHDFNELPNIYYPAPPPATWHPDFGPFYPTYAPNMEVPYFFNGSHEPPMDTGEEIDRRALFVGNIEDGLTDEEFARRFEKFGHIQRVKIHFRDNQNNYGFVYFTEERYVLRAIKHGNDDPDLPHYKLGVGIRKERCADRRAVTYEKGVPVSNYPTHGYREDPFNLKLEKFKNDLRQKKFNDRYK